MQVLLKATLAGVSGVPGLVQEPLNACELELTFWLPGVVLPVTVNAVFCGAGVENVALAPAASVVVLSVAPFETASVLTVGLLAGLVTVHAT